MFCILWSILTCGYRHLVELIASTMDSPVALALLSLFIAVIIMINLHSANLLCASTVRANGGSSSAAARVADAQDMRKCFSSTNRANFDYSIRHGPHTWQHASDNQSPINIDATCVKDRLIMHPLNWMHCDELPKGIMLENNGKTLVLRAAYGDNTPMLVGADLLSCYSFVELCFRWSSSDTEGSEHTLNNKHFPLELQAMHRVSRPGKTSSFDVLMVSYFYELATDNPYMNTILSALVLVQQAGKRIEIPPFPLRFLMPPFQSYFYSYNGSLTEPPCHSGIEWLIYPEPLAIGASQLNELRQLRNRYGARIMSNARPVQPLGQNRVVFWNVFAPQNDSIDSSGSSSTIISGSSNNDDSAQLMNKYSKCCSHANSSDSFSLQHLHQIE